MTADQHRKPRARRTVAWIVGSLIFLGLPVLVVRGLSVVVEFGLSDRVMFGLAVGWLTAVFAYMAVLGRRPSWRRDRAFFVAPAALGLLVGILAPAWERAACGAWSLQEGVIMRAMVERMSVTLRDDPGATPLPIDESRDLFKDYFSDRCCGFALEDYAYGGQPLAEALDPSRTEGELRELQTIQRALHGGLDPIGPFIVHFDRDAMLGFSATTPIVILQSPIDRDGDRFAVHVAFADHHVESTDSPEDLPESLNRWQMPSLSD
ncbi:MAG: hypothetical protein AAGI30_04240 [Planctomycetota bacterium]